MFSKLTIRCVRSAAPLCIRRSLVRGYSGAGVPLAATGNNRHQKKIALLVARREAMQPCIVEGKDSMFRLKEIYRVLFNTPFSSSNDDWNISVVDLFMMSGENIPKNIRTRAASHLVAIPFPQTDLNDCRIFIERCFSHVNEMEYLCALHTSNEVLLSVFSTYEPRRCRVHLMFFVAITRTLRKNPHIVAQVVQLIRKHKGTSRGLVAASFEHVPLHKQVLIGLSRLCMLLSMTPTFDDALLMVDEMQALTDAVRADLQPDEVPLDKKNFIDFLTIWLKQMRERTQLAFEEGSIEHDLLLD